MDQSIELVAESPGIYRGDSPKAYWNMVGPYGGITATIALQAVLIDDRLVGEPLSLTVNFCAPLLEGGYRCDVHCVRTNRSTQHWRIELIQQKDDRPIVVVQAMVVSGVRRPGWDLPVARPPAGEFSDATFRRDGRNGLPWFDRYELRFEQNPMKSEDPGADLLAWVRDDPPRTLDYCSLAAMCDTLFPAILSHRKAFVPIATVSMSTYFHCDAKRLSEHGDAPLKTVSRSQVHNQGFCDASGEMWANDTLVATTQQVMWYRQEK